MAEKSEGTTEKIIGLKPAQVAGLQRLLQGANQVKLAAAAAEQAAQSYVQSIADAHGVNGYLRMRLSSEKKTLTFTLVEK